MLVLLGFITLPAICRGELYALTFRAGINPAPTWRVAISSSPSRFQNSLCTSRDKPHDEASRQSWSRNYRQIVISNEGEGFMPSPSLAGMMTKPERIT